MVGIERRKPETDSNPFIQVLTYTIKPVTDLNTCYIINSVKYLRSGDEVTGVIQPTGSWEKEEPNWVFSILYREGTQECFFYARNVGLSGYWGENKHAFGFTADKEGNIYLR